MSDSPTPLRIRPSRLLLGLAVLVCTAVALASTAFRRREDPSWQRIHADFEVIHTALEKYRAARGSLPEEGSLELLVPEFLPAVPVDPWGRPYVYSSNGKRPMLITFGHDGERGGSGPEQDHTLYDGHGR
ncbi:MAG: type II secretion system protein GspG [Myxococcaceae bacterium]|nr:type II secretion system protein GspG [Myxococcaceae bacterium]